MPDPRETGWGEPDDLAGSGFDIGWGSPDDLATPGADTGWGSPSYITGAALSASVCADDGGEILTLTGDFTGYAGPYTVTLYDGPDAADHPCYGLIFGEGYVCRPNDAGTSMEFVTPPLQVGTYSLRLVGEGGATQEFPNALVVVRRMWRSGVYDMRKRFPPEAYPTGPQDIESEPLLGSSGPVAAITTKLRAETVKAIGEELAQLGGSRSTRLTAAFAPADTTANVESTHLMPDEGVVYVEGLDTPRLAYTGRTATTLTGITRDAYETKTADLGAAVIDWNRLESYYEQARADLLVEYASGTGLDDFGALYGCPRGGAWMTDATYATLLETVASLDRINWRAIFRVCDAWTAQFRDPQSSSVSGAAVVDPTGSYFRADHYGRWIRITDTDGTQRLHRIKAVAVGVGVVLHAGSGPYWEASAYATGARTWEIVPFWLERVPGEVRVFVALPPEYAAVPHYITELAEGTYAGVVPPDMTGLVDPVVTGGGDESGYVLEDPDTASSTLDPAYPFYIGGGGLEMLQIVLDDVVADGIIVTTSTVPA